MTADGAVDVVVPVRNGGRRLRAAVDSVLSQANVAVSVVVVDDGSSDGAPARLPSDPRLVVVRNAGRGIPAALNTGASVGSAPLIARQDADDESLPGRLAAQVEHLAAHPGIGLVATAFEVVAGERVVATLTPSPRRMLDVNPISAGSTVVRRSVLAAAGGYREAFRLSSDYDAWLRCVALSGVSILPIVGYRYRLSADMSTIRAGGLQAAYADLARAGARARLLGMPEPPVTVPGEPAPDPEVDAWWAREFAALGARTDALRCAARACRRLPPRRVPGVLAAALGRPTPQALWS